VNKKLKILSLQFITFCFLEYFLPLRQAGITLTTGEGSGVPGAIENPVTVHMENLNDMVKGVSVDVCDVDDYLSCTGCEVTERASGFLCFTNELTSGCCRVVLLDMGGRYY